MWRYHFIIVLAAWALIGFASSSQAIAQIDYRVNTGNTGTAGRANDANPAVGSAGLNQPVPRFDAGGYSNAVISGNVTGLAGFKGYSPIPQANAFRAPLPSAALSSFRGTSVGITDVTSNRVLGPNRYYDVEETVSDVGFVRSGLNAPGSSTLASPNIVPPSAAMSPPVIGLRPIPAMTDLRVDQQYNRGMLIGLQQQSQAAPGLVPPAGPGEQDWRYRSAAGSSIFGVPPLAPIQARNGLLPGMFPTAAEEEGTAESSAAMSALGASGLQPAVLPESGGGSEVGGSGAATGNMPNEAGPGNPAFEQRGPGGMQLPSGQAPRNLGGDRFSDLLSAVQMAQRMGVKKLGFETVSQAGQEGAAGAGRGGVEPTQGGAAGLEPIPPMRRSLLRRPSTSGLAEMATAARWASDLLESPMKSFAGRYQDRLNGYLRDGETALHKGEYYRAADLFDLASTVDPTNPLPLLNRGHALLAAGDYVSAATSLERGIARFPQIAAFQIDLPALGGSIYDVRRADLEKKLASSDQYRLRFLLGYLELYSGLPEEGIRDLEQAAKAAPPDSIISIFADLVTNRKELPALPPLQGLGEPPG